MARPLRVAVNLAYFRPGGVGGSETYVRETLRRIAASGRVQLTVLCWSGASSVFASWPETRVVEVSRGRYGTARRLLAEHLVAPWSARGSDVLFSPGNFAAPLGRWSLAQVATVHDLQHFALPEHFSPATRVYRTAMFRANVRCCSRIITMSEFTRQELIGRCGARPDQVAVVPLGCDLDSAVARGEHGASKTRELPTTYVFYPAATWPHKNHTTAISAVEKVRASGIDVHLVLSGARGGAFPALSRPIPPFVRDLGHLRRRDLHAVLAGAKALVFPSLFEGFGIPLLEAMYAGVPVIASRSAAIPEVVGRAGVLLEPRDVPGWAAAIARACTDEAWANAAVARGLEHAAAYSWDACAARTLEVLESVACW